MARPLRIEFENAFYHVTSRGNAKQSIYINDDDRNTFLGILSKVVKRFHWLCYAYCLMNNHYHLMVETPEANLSGGMRQLNGVYTQKFNRRHDRVGHLFQGRYKAILVEKESYLLELARYVVLNPVRAGIVTDPQDWSWSSYRATMGLEKAPDFLIIEWILGQFSEQRSRARTLYRLFVNEGRGERPWEDLKGGIFLGKEGFVEKLEPYLEERFFDKEIPKIQRLVTRPKLEEIFNEEKLKGIKDRDDRIYQAVNDYGYTLKEVSNFLGLHYSTISKAYTRAGKDDKFKT